MTIANLSPLGQEIFEARYAYPGETKWSERAKAIAKVVASAETDEDKEKIEKYFYDVVGSGDFIPGGRIIYGAGRNRGNHNLLNCYVIIPEDSVDSIGKTIQDMYRISCAGGGVGFNVSKIRPKGDDIGTVLAGQITNSPTIIFTAKRDFTLAPTTGQIVHMTIGSRAYEFSGNLHVLKQNARFIAEFSIVAKN